MIRARFRLSCRLEVVVLGMAAFGFASGVLAREPASPTGSPVPVPAGELEFFEAKIRPLLVKRCFECHAAQGKGVKGGLRLDHRAGILAGGDSGPAVVPGKPDESLLIDAISYKQESAQMPPRGKLPQAEIDLLTEWVRRGAAFPEGIAKQVEVETRSGIDFQRGRQFWSFQPLREQPLPRASDATWPSRRIDWFVVQKLEEAGITPSPAADRRTLLRRLAFDLTGLPPTAEEVEAFESDSAEGAIERQVERLLASPHYGERWGRFWLDLVRYCDVLESWAIDKHAQAWLYRDWVVQAWNDDLPFDQFLELQMAADLRADSRPEDIAALGFLGLSPSYWKELKLDPGVIKAVIAEEWEERIHTLTGAVLGLTVACARCHDHKQDPISQSDYYALAGVFASTRLTPRSILPSPEAEVVARAREQIQALQKNRDELLAKKPEPTAEEKQQAEGLAARIAELERTTPHYDVPLAYAAEEASLFVLPDGPDRTKLEYRAGEPQNVSLQIRGNPSNAGPVVPRRFLTVLTPDKPRSFEQGSGRLELARAFVNEAAPLTARVIVNRIWQQHFGRGLVDTPSNFGATGSPPSHAELLDDLAARFIANGWSLKWLHRELVLSSAYRESSGFDALKYAIDPDNRLLWRSHRRRLEVEAWRDAMLVSSGGLDRNRGGPDRNLDDPLNHRRTLYGTVKRRDLHPMLRLLDFPDPTTHNATRDLTTTPLQQLFVLNSPFMRAQARELVDRVRREASDDFDAQVRRIYRLLFARAPTGGQLELARKFFSAPGGGIAQDDELWVEYAQTLLSSNEFAFVD